jgi:hypothetical protein
MASRGRRACDLCDVTLDSSIDLSYRTYHADREGYVWVLLEEQGEGHTVNAGDVVTRCAHSCEGIGVAASDVNALEEWGRWCGGGGAVEGCECSGA